MADVADRLKVARERFPLSQRELGQRSGVAVSSIADIERRHVARPRPATIRALAQALGVDAGWLATGREPDGRPSRDG